MAVPLMDIQAQYAPLRAEIDAAIAGVLDRGRFVLGPEGRALEAAVSERLGGRPAVGVANGTDALVIALQALGMGPGDEVITTPYTFYATAEAIARVGATPVFADIDPVTYCLDPAAAEARVGPATKAILPVHIFGHPVDMAAIASLADAHGLAVVEDAAQAFGAATADGEVGTFGDAATFSFFPTKNFPGMGDGGMVVCRDEALAERVRRLRFHGSADKVVFEEVGYNSRLDDLQAAVIRVFYPHLDEWNARRARAAAWYAEEGLGERMTLPGVAPGARHIYHLFMGRHPRRDHVRAALAEAGVGSAVYYGIPMHLQPVFAPLGYSAGDLPVAEECARTALALPMHPNLTREDVAEVAAAVERALEGRPVAAPSEGQAA
jgi:dTDP-4-amino-4,6-dideoxygalactose transaminase